MGGRWGPGRRTRWCSKIEKEGVGMNQAKFWAIEVSKLAKMKGNSQQKYIFNTTELYSHIQSSPG